VKLLPSQRGHLYVLERSRVYQRDGRIEYASDEGREPKGFNIPVANTCFVLLGPGSSVTTEAMRQLKQEGVCVGFCGSGGTPLLTADDPYPDLLLPADEYRDPRPLQRWIELWRCPKRRLAAAKALADARLDAIEAVWPKLDTRPAFDPPDQRLDQARRAFGRAGTTEELLGVEGSMARDLYHHCARVAGMKDFQRKPQARDRGVNMDDPNRLLDRGNYLAYGLASVVCWTLGLPASLAVIHGRTRRGGLVFDIADVVKDAVILPLAFATAVQARTEPVADTDFRAACLAAFVDHGALPTMFKAVERAMDEAGC